MIVAADQPDPVTGVLKLLLRSFRLRGFEENYELIAEHANTENLTYETFLYEVSKVEAEERRNRKIERRLKDSRLPREKTLETFDLARVPSVSKQLVTQLCDGTLIDRAEMDVLFTLFAERYERKSVMITSNLVFSKWDQIFRDAMTTAAAIDRLVHHARILELNTESYRAAKAHDRRRGKGPEKPDESAKAQKEGEP